MPSFDPTSVFSAAFKAAFPTSGMTFNALIERIQNSPLLMSMLQGLPAVNGGNITLAAAGAGTSNNGTSLITVDPAMIALLTGSYQNLNYNLDIIAGVLAHELGHIELTPASGQVGQLTNAANPDAARQVGIIQEGSAVVAEYVAAQQLKLTGGYPSIALYSGVHNSTLQPPLDADALGYNLTTTDLTALKGAGLASFVNAATNDGGASYAGSHPSTSPQLTYNQLWVDEWINSIYGYPIDLSKLTNIAFGESGDSLAGWNWSARYLDLQGISFHDVMTGTDVILSPGETASIYGGKETSAGDIDLGTEILNVPGSSTLSGGSGNDVFMSRPGANKYFVNFGISGHISTGNNAVERVISNESGAGSVVVKPASLASLFTVGRTPIRATGKQMWTDGTESFQFISPGSATFATDSSGLDLSEVQKGSSVGELKISNAGGSSGNTVEIFGFDLQKAEQTGFLGIKLPSTVSLNKKANNGVDTPSTPYPGGSWQSFTVSADAASPANRTFTLALAGAAPSDFDVLIGNQLEAISASDTFTVSLAASETSVAFSLVDNTGSTPSDLASGAPIQLVGYLADQTNPNGSPSQTTPLQFSYVPPAPIDSTPAHTINGALAGGTTNYVGDQSNDYVSAGAGPNNINLVASLNDTVVGNSNTSVIIAGNGTNQIFAGSQLSVAAAIAASASATATGLQGDLIAVGHGNNTIVSGNGNDFITSDTERADGTGGNEVIVLGPGNDSYIGGIEVTGALPNWTVTNGSTGSGVYYTPSNIFSNPVGYVNPFPQPYNGSLTYYGPDGASNATIYGGTGSDFILLGNGSNYVDVGSGNTTVGGGMGNDTIVAGSGTQVILGGGGSTFIAGGSGTETIAGGDGDSTIVGGSGNATIYSSTGPGLVFNFPNANLTNHFVTGGSGNDLIYGSAGSDTLLGGSGNVTIYGGSGTENIEGGAGNDYLVGGSGNSTVAAGGGGRDSLFGIGSSSSTTVLDGGTGSDYIVGGSGANEVHAGDGGVAGTATSILASQSDAAATTTIYGGRGVDLIEGGVGASVIYAGDGGTAAAPTSVIGYKGTDTIHGGGGTDILQAGSGRTVIYAGSGGTSGAPTTVIGGSGADSLYGESGAALIQDTHSGNSLLVAGSGNSTLTGISGDTLVAGSGSDLVQALSGVTTFEVDAGFNIDTLQGVGGQFSLHFGSGLSDTDFHASVVFDGQGKDQLVLNGDNGSIVVQRGLTGAFAGATNNGFSPIPLRTLLLDTFGGDTTYTNGITASRLTVALADSDSLSLNSGDTVSSWGDNDSLNSSVATGTYVFSAGSGASITSNGNDSINAVGANASVIAYGYSERITVAGANSLVDVQGGSIDTIYASGANDTIAPEFSGDLIVVNAASTVITGALSTDTIDASVSYSAPLGLTNLFLIGTANIIATGNTGADSLVAGAGADTLIALSGTTTLVGGTGNTTFVVNNSGVKITDTVVAANNTVQSSVNFTLGSNINTLQLNGTSALTATGNSANDTLISNSGVDTLFGGPGNDTFVINNPNDTIVDSGGTATIIYQGAGNYALPSGSNLLILQGTVSVQATGNSGPDSLISNSGADTLVGGSGNDVFVVNNALDVIQDAYPAASNLIQTSVNFTLPTNVNALTLLGTSALSGTGNGASDTLTANSGNDTLIAGSGLATLIGGAGNDTFIINNTADVIQDTVAASNSVVSSVSVTLGTNLNSLILTGTAALIGTANSSADTLTSNSGADTLVGGSGTDLFVVTNAGVVVTNAAGAVDTISSAVTYSLPTSVSTLLLTGTAAIVGTANGGSDTIVANAGADTLVGGAGPDLFIVNSAADVVSVPGAHGSDTIQSSVTFTLPSAVNSLFLTGSSNLTGVALSGNNALTGNAGNDILKAGSGTDTLIAGSGLTTLIGGSSADTFVLNNPGDVLQSLSGTSNTVLTSFNYTLPSAVNALVLTGTSALTATGNSVADQITSNSGNDTLVAGAGADTFYSGQGSNLFIINNASDQVVLSNSGTKVGTDTIDSSVSYTIASVTTLLLTGTANLTASESSGKASTLIGNAGHDTLTAGTAADTLVAGSGVSTLVGGTANDTFVVNNSADAVQDTSSAAANVLVATASYTLPSNVNTLQLSGTAPIRGSGNSANDSLVAGAGADTLVAGSGTDTLVAGSGLTTLVGGAGADTYIVDNSADLILSASTASNLVLSSSNYTLPTNVNRLTLTGVADIAGTGNAASDTLTGGSGNDTLVAGSGPATLIGGAGNTNFVVNSASDVIVESSTITSNVVQSTIDYSLGANINTLVLLGTAALKGTANAANDTLVSNSGLDTLIGASGNETFVINNSSDVVQDTAGAASNVANAAVNYSLAANVNTLILTGTSALKGTANSASDTLVSNAGTDTLIGGAGTDVFVVNNSLDAIIESAVGSGSSVQTTVNYTLPTNVNLMTLIGANALVGTGNGAADFITANSADDTLVAGTGVATLIGGSGNDTFVVNNAGDVVQDTASASNNVLLSSVSYTLATNVNTLMLTGSANLLGKGEVLGHDLLIGNAGNDTLVAANQMTTLEGGTGNDLFVLSSPGDLVTVDNTFGVDTVQSTYSYTLPTNIASLILSGTNSISGTLSNLDGILVANSANDTLIAGTGNDTLYGGAGSDLIVGGIGNDALYAGSGGTSASPTSVSDLSTSPGHSTLYGGSGYSNLHPYLTDTVVAGSGTQSVVIDSSGTQTLLLNSGFGTIHASGSNATSEFNMDFGTGIAPSALNITAVNDGGALGLSISTGTSTFYDDVSLFPADPTAPAVAGINSVSFADSGSLSLTQLIAQAHTTGANVASGSNSLEFSVANSSSISSSGTYDTISAWGNNDTLTGGGTSREYISASGNADSASAGSATYASLLAQGTADTLVGGSGTASFYINNASDVVVQATANGDADVLYSSVSYTLPTNVGALRLTGTAALTATANSDTGVYVYGNSANDTLVGGSGASNLFAGSGNQLLLGGSGSVSMQAGSGNDTLQAGAGLAAEYAGTGNDLFIVNDINDTVYGGQGNDTLQTSVNFSLPAGVGTMVLTGTADLRAVDKTGGSNLLVANTGNDYFVIGSGADTVQIGGVHGIDTIEFAGNNALYTMPANVDTLVVSGTADTIVGNGDNDAISSSGTNVLIAGSGVDTLNSTGITTVDGGSGVDTLIGGAGNDLFILYDGGVIQDTYTTTNNVVQSQGGFTLPANVNTLILTSPFDEVGAGNSANDSIVAGGGRDTLVSGTGIDTLVGGSAPDTFIISNSADVVQDTVSGIANILYSSVSFSLPTNVNRMILTGTAALSGTANNSANDTLTANNGADTLVSGTGSVVDSLVGGTGADLFVVNNASDKVNVGATHGVDTVQSSVTFTAPTNVNDLVLIGTANIAGTGNTLSNVLAAGAGADTLTAGSGVATLIGGAGNDTFVINSLSDLVQDTYTGTSNVLSSSVSYTLPTNINRLVLTGTAALMGTANAANDTLTANNAADTLVSGTGVDSLVGGTGADLFIVNTSADVISVGATHGVDTIQSSVSYTASANVANLVLTGTAALLGVGNSLAGTITANTGNDTLAAGTGADTLIGGSTGTDTFVVNSASDVVKVTATGTSDTVQSSASFTLPTNVQYLLLTGTGALTGTGNAATSLIIGNTGNDTLIGGTGVAVLEGGRTAGSDVIKSTAGQAALIGGAGSATLTGGAFKDFFAAGLVSDSITSGATANVVAVNKGDGATTLAPTTGATNVLTLGAGIDTENLKFTKSGNNLVLSDGVAGDSITFTNWYAATANQDYTKLQVIELASASYNGSGGDALRNKPIEAFNFTTLVAAFNTAGSPANWALSNAMPTAALTTSASAAFGGDLAYYFGLNGNLTGLNLSDAQATLTNASYGTVTQAINSFGTVSGGGGLHLAIVKGQEASPMLPVADHAAVSAAAQAQSESAAPPSVHEDRMAEQGIAPVEKSFGMLSVEPVRGMRGATALGRGHLPLMRGFDLMSVATGADLNEISRTVAPRFSPESHLGDAVPPTTARIADPPAHEAAAQAVSEPDPIKRTFGRYVSPTNVAWAIMHSQMDALDLAAGGSEAAEAHSLSNTALIGSPLTRLHPSDRVSHMR